MRRLLIAFCMLTIFGTLIASTNFALPVKAAADVDVLSHTGYIDSFGYYHVIGELQNVGDRTLEFVKIEVRLYNSHGVFIENISDTTMLNVLLPGRKSPFDVVLLDETKSANVDHYTLRITFSVTDPLPIGLDILSHNSHVDDSGYMHVVGQIKNVANAIARAVKIVVTYYDEDGDVVAAQWEYIDPDQPTIDPGQTAPFEIILNEERTPLVATYELTAESAEFAVSTIQYNLTIQVSGSGTTDPTPGTYTYDRDVSINVVAISNTGWNLSYWLLDDVNIGSKNPCTITMNSYHYLTAVFVEVPPGQYKLAIEVVGNGTTDPAPGIHFYDMNSNITLTAIPSSGWVLSHWLLNDTNVGSINPYKVTMDNDYNLTAVFTEIPPPVEHSLIVEVRGSGTTNPASGTYTYAETANVSVKAVPDPGWMFSHWLLNGTNVGSASPYEITMDANYNLTGVFVEIFPSVQYKLVIAAQGSGTTDPAPDTYLYDKNSVVSVSAFPSSGWIFSSWLLNGTDVGSANPYKVTMDGNYSLTAVYTKTPEFPTWALIISIFVVLVIALIIYRRIRSSQQK